MYQGEKDTRALELQVENTNSIVNPRRKGVVKNIESLSFFLASKPIAVIMRESKRSILRIKEKRTIDFSWAVTRVSREGMRKRNEVIDKYIRSPSY